MFYRFWLRLGLQHGAILGAKTPQMVLKLWQVAPQQSLCSSPFLGLNTNLLLKTVQEPLGLDLWGGQDSIFDDFWMIFWNFLAYFGHVFGCSFLTWFSLFFVRSSTNFAKKIQELAEDKAENPRTCRGQSREENPYERLQENSDLQAFFFQTPFLIATLPTPKTLGGGTPPRGASIRRPSRDGVLDGDTRSSYPPSGLLPDSSSQRFLFSPS